MTKILITRDTLDVIRTFESGVWDREPEPRTDGRFELKLSNDAFTFLAEQRLGAETPNDTLARIMRNLRPRLCH